MGKQLNCLDTIYTTATTTAAMDKIVVDDYFDYLSNLSKLPSGFEMNTRQEHLFYHSCWCFWNRLFCSDLSILQFHFSSFDFARYKQTQDGFPEFLCKLNSQRVFSTYKLAIIQNLLYSNGWRMVWIGGRRLDPVICGDRFLCDWALLHPIQQMHYSEQKKVAGLSSEEQKILLY